MKPRIIVTGSLGFDVIMDFPGRFADRIMPDKLHQISLSFLVDTMKKQFGGTAGNIAYTLKLLGNDPLIVSSAGHDFGPYAAFLRKHTISTKYIATQKDLLTSVYSVITDTDDNQIGAFYIGASQKAENLSLTSLPRSSFTVIAPTVPTAMERYVKECVANTMPYLFDPAFQTNVLSPEVLREGIGHAKVFIGNDYEIALVEKRLNISHTELCSMVPVVITTLGAQGSRIESKEKTYSIAPAKPLEIVDPTGAGDAYRGGFLTGYLRGLDLQTCGQMGAVAAAYTVEKYGTVTYMYTIEEFCERYRQNYGSRLSL